MAENTENTGESLNQVAEKGVAQPQIETNETSQLNEAPQSGEQTAISENESSADQSLEEIPLDKLEEKLSRPAEKQTTEEDKKQEEEVKTEPTQVDASQEALNKQNKTNRSENRYQQLANENRLLKQQLDEQKRAGMQSLAKEVGLPKPPWKNDQSKPIVPKLEVQPGTEITQEQYQQHVSEAAKKIAAAEIEAYKLQAQEEIEKQQKIVQLDESMNYIKQRYPELDPEHPNYSQEADEMIGQIVASMGQVDPAGIKQRVDQIMALRGQSVQVGQAQATQTLAKQMAESAVIPNSSIREQSASLDDISLDKLEQKLGVVS